MLFIIIVIFIVLVLLYKNNNEFFVSNLSIVDPSPLYLFKDITQKEDWWNNTHGRKLYYYRDYVPEYYKE